MDELLNEVCCAVSRLAQGLQATDGRGGGGVSDVEASG